MAQWVQHKSEQGEKWEVSAELGPRWVVKQGNDYYQLPKSEYGVCTPPPNITTNGVVWNDVTGECEVRVLEEKGSVATEEYVYHDGRRLAKLSCGGRYRLTKHYMFINYNGILGAQHRWVFTIERRA